MCLTDGAEVSSPGMVIMFTPTEDPIPTISGQETSTMRPTQAVPEDVAADALVPVLAPAQAADVPAAARKTHTKCGKNKNKKDRPQSEGFCSGVCVFSSIPIEKKKSRPDWDDFFLSPEAGSLREQLICVYIRSGCIRRSRDSPTG